MACTKFRAVSSTSLALRPSRLEASRGLSFSLMICGLGIGLGMRGKGKGKGTGSG
jgi:hypothetical protein